MSDKLLHEKMEALQRSRDALKHQVFNYAEEIEKYKDLKVKLKQQIVCLKMKNENNEILIKECSAENNAIKCVMYEEVTKLNEENIMQVDKLLAKDDEIKKLQKMNGFMKGRVTTLINERDDLKKTNQVVKMKFEGELIERVRCQNRSSDAKMLIKDLSKINDTLKFEIIKKDKKIKGIENVARLCDDEQPQRKEDENKIKQLQKMLQHLQGETVNIELNGLNKDKQITRLEQTVKAQKEMMTDFKQQINMVNESRDDVIKNQSKLIEIETKSKVRKILLLKLREAIGMMTAMRNGSSMFASLKVSSEIEIFNNIQEIVKLLDGLDELKVIG